MNIFKYTNLNTVSLGLKLPSVKSQRVNYAKQVLPDLELETLYVNFTS